MAEPLTVMTWFWRQDGGRTTYSAETVNIWADMVSRNLRLPHRLACVTAHPEGIDPRVAIIEPPSDFEDVTIGTWGQDKPQCLRRIAMFRPDAAEIFGKRFVSMDMDCIITGPLDPLFDRADDFVMYRGTHQVRPYNGSMMMMTAGVRPEVYERFTPGAAAEAGQRFIGSDQAWISHVLGAGEATWGVEDGVYAYGSRQAGPLAAAKIVFCLGMPKPWGLVDQGEPWVEHHYRRDPRGGRCLILGYGPDLWTDALAAMAGGEFEAIIASPEAAAHWPRPVDAIAMDDDHALRLARMKGFDEVVVCGAQRKEAA